MRNPLHWPDVVRHCVANTHNISIDTCYRTTNESMLYDARVIYLHKALASAEVDTACKLVDLWSPVWGIK